MSRALSIYITADGDYGDAHGMYDQVLWKTIVPTFFYTDDMWEEFDRCEPKEREALHFHFTLGAPAHDIQEEYGACSYCHLTLEELGYKTEENDDA